MMVVLLFFLLTVLLWSSLWSAVERTKRSGLMATRLAGMYAHLAN